jgi:outer membrane protein assembly factor BamB
LSFSFKEEKEIKIDFDSDRIMVLKDEIILYCNGNIYFLNENGEIISSIPLLGFEKGKISEFIDFTTDGNTIFILGKDKIINYNLYGEFLKEFFIDLPRPMLLGIVFPFGIFIFDESFQKVMRYDFDGKKKGEFYVKNGDIMDMDVDENYIYFYDKEGKIFVYNFYGNKVKEFKLKSGKKINVHNEIIFLIDEQNLYVFDKNREIYSEGLTVKDMYLKDDNLYILSKNIKIRKIEK